MNEDYGFKSKGGKTISADDTFELRKVIAPYGKAAKLDTGNTFLGTLQFNMSISIGSRAARWPMQDENNKPKFF